ncbi:hypothetical protein Rsub_07887 [Raphidocelis subcapitata]|uniref:Uncharacterized protein n=1 Tax=Raphidocelis subcapitata TaxID=307507 RepID=A0A2V0P5M7_9CHLO|nr:hypothetical protein Rsub_07887 [Raphidocelis subcapitata]|eukprot:GBF95174.1 hypothetical protein Rsub_07887 [Raphidocelis subcapitata]
MLSKAPPTRVRGPRRGRPALAPLFSLLLLAAAAAPGASAAPPACEWFPAGSPLRRDVSGLPVHPYSSDIVAAIGNGGLHPDFGDHTGSVDGVPSHDVVYGIPINAVDTGAGDLFYPMDFDYYDDESDLGPYPFQPDAAIEGAWPGCGRNTPPRDGDRHVLAVDAANCTLYEAWRCADPAADTPPAFPPWRCANGAVFDLRSPQMPQRPLGWTSGDAAGLPIAPLLVRVADVLAGSIPTAIRFTGPNSRAAYERPAAHFAPRNPKAHSPWMGMRARLKGSFPCGGFTTATARVVCAAMQKTGLVFADNGGPWFFSGEASSEWWTNPALGPMETFQAELKSIPASAMEVVYTGECLCTQSDCSACEPPPPLAGGGAMEFAAGRPVVAADGSHLAAAYGGMEDAAISNVGGAPNGATALGPPTGELSESPPAAAAGRFLLRFRGLQTFLPPKTRPARSVLLALSFDNHGGGGAAAGEVWFVDKAWGADGALGWQQRTANAKWRAPGAWPQGASGTRPVKNSVRFSVPPGAGQSVQIELPLGGFQKWLKRGGRKNFGLLVKLAVGTEGPVVLAGGAHPDAQRRPLLRVEYEQK